MDNNTMYGTKLIEPSSTYEAFVQEKGNHKGKDYTDTDFTQFIKRDGMHILIKSPQNLSYLAVLCCEKGYINTLKEIDKLDPSQTRGLITDVSKTNSSNSDNFSLLSIASQQGSAEVVRFLMARGFDPSAPDTSGRTPLHFAVANGNANIVNILIKGGAKINSEDKERKTPLHLAAEKGHTNIVNILVQNGAIINARDKDRKTALHFAAENAYTNIVTILINAGPFSTINTQAQDGKTALHFAAEKGHSDVIKALIAAKADSSITDNNGRTAVQLAVEREKTLKAQEAESARIAALKKANTPAKKSSLLSMSNWLFSSSSQNNKAPTKHRGR